MNDSISGQIQAISLALSAVISTLPPGQAAQAALALAVDLSQAQDADADNGATPQETASRDAVANGFLSLLGAVSRA